MKLRPHHLLCIRAFKGNGYSKSFINNMNKIIELISKNENVDIESCLDDICFCCPNNVNKKCLSEEKVNRIDQNVIKLLGIKVGINQSYLNLENKILSGLTRDSFNEICCDCEWKQSCVCTFEDVNRKIG